MVYGVNMNGAEAFVATLAACGVDTCFANPGTSEMQLVAAIDRQPEMRAVLCLFEGVVTGAADGYARMADRPAVTLLHLGPGLANGLANLHNARRAGSPVINMVGDHATYHLQFNAPLTSDAAGVARPMSDWVRTAQSARDLAQVGAEAYAAAMEWPGRVATVIVPANHAWTEGSAPVAPRALAPAPRVPDAVIADAVQALRASTGPVALLLGGRALRADALHMAGRIAAVTGARLVCETFAARVERGVGRVGIDRLPYFGEMAAEYLAPCTTIVTCGTEPPVAFFAYPDKPGTLWPHDATVVRLASSREDMLAALEHLADALDAPADPAGIQPRVVPSAGDRLDAHGVGAVLAELMPAGAIVSDEGLTASAALFEATRGAAPHDWLMVTGGSIGQGLPVATGAAVACPGRQVIALQADGSGMYTCQALWTMARERLNVVTVIFNNASYAILNIELSRVGVRNAGPKALSMLSLDHPRLDWCALASGMGVPAERVDTVADFRAALARALAGKGPALIEAML
ncbi:acetolactate synthase large subunit [Novosphingobium sp.]|uniref:acetolactate synthase large subunit n=1 Tax=Novosphingobium sp. TaxID=1874826 RepID=UPI003340548D